jgi:hypothetical protein
MTRFAAALVSAAVLGVAPIAGTGVAAAEPDAPDLGGYQQTSAEPYTFADGAYFQTPGGLLCAIRPAQGRAGCDGTLPGAPAGANEIVLAADQPGSGLRATDSRQFVKSTGPAAAVLPAGHKIVVADFECAVGDGPNTVCTKGTPAAQWMQIGPSGATVGPATPGLPAGFPDPKDFVVSDQSYVVGAGPKNIFPVFTVSGGLTCKMAMFSGGEIGCDGKLPGINTGDDEVYVQLPGAVGTRKAGNPPFGQPAYPGTIKQLPAGHRIDSYGATCMATTDGGTACYGAVGGPPQGFAVTSSATTTFGGS